MVRRIIVQQPAPPRMVAPQLSVTPFAPWQMWGTSQNVTVPGGLDPRAGQQFTAQLAKINYARPDTWSFLFVATLNVVPAVPPPATEVRINCDFDLTVGVGRSAVTLVTDSIMTGTSVVPPGFVRLQFVYNSPTNEPGRSKWTSVARAEVDDAGTFVTMDHFPAQDIQCQARVSNATDAPALHATETRVTVSAYFAPRSHIRPEWFSDSDNPNDRFRGNETGGT
jgi:hypothetical protein